MRNDRAKLAGSGVSPPGSTGPVFAEIAGPGSTRGMEGRATASLWEPVGPAERRKGAFEQSMAQVAGCDSSVSVIFQADACAVFSIEFMTEPGSPCHYINCETP